MNSLKVMALVSTVTLMWSFPGEAQHPQMAQASAVCPAVQNRLEVLPAAYSSDSIETVHGLVSAVVVD